jgi:hypothetical protein
VHGGFLLGVAGAKAASMSKAATGARYYVFNVLAELDNEGEFYLSRTGTDKGMLYFQPVKGSWPPSAGALDNAVVSSATNLVVLAEGTSHVSFVGISFMHTRSTIITSVRHPAEATVSHITIDTCTVANAGGSAIHLQGYNNVVIGTFLSRCTLDSATKPKTLLCCLLKI